MFTYPVQIRNYDSDWLVSVTGHRNAVKLREHLVQLGVTPGSVQELDGTANYAFRVPQSAKMSLGKIKSLVSESPNVRLID